MNTMTTDRETHIKIVAARLRRRKDNGETNQQLFLEDLDMLLDLILGGEA